MIELDLEGARVAFSTRHGGVSEGPYATLNLGILIELSKKTESSPVIKDILFAAHDLGLPRHRRRRQRFALTGADDAGRR